MQELIEQIMYSLYIAPKNNQTGLFFSFSARAQCFLIFYVLVKNLPSFVGADFQLKSRNFKAHRACFIVP